MTTEPEAVNAMTTQPAASTAKPAPVHAADLTPAVAWSRRVRRIGGPTPGHTPGSMSMLIRRPGRPPLMMVGDVTYDAHLLEIGHVPGVGCRRRLRKATAMVNQMRHQYPGLVILPAHDPGAAGRLAQATGQAPTLASA
jgi:glyoxylase-like metal-dependent hydrolase (beta-lactamase superfamily II)